jgi:hypothetical protein
MARNRDDEQGATPRPGVLRRLTGRANALPRSDSERINAIAHDAHLPVEDVLREVADFRLALETDMIIAAAAADEGAPELLTDMLDGERAELATFHDRLLDRLADAAASDEVALRRDRRKPARQPSRYVAAAAAAFAILSAGRVVTQPKAHTDSNRVALATANSQYVDLSSAVTSTKPGAVHDAAQQLHATLKTLIAQHAGDPGVAEQAAQLLQAEISLLQVQDPAGATAAIAQARQLVNMLKRNAPDRVRATVGPILDAVSPAPTTPSPKPAKSPKPSPKPTTASPTASPTPTSTPTASGGSGGNSNKDGSSQGPVQVP